MKQYETYKTTNITWLDKIPKHWVELRGKYLYQKVIREPKENDEVITCFRDGQVTLRKNRRLGGFTESIKEIGYQHIKEGDLVIHVMDAFAGAIGVSDSNGKGSPVYNVCVARVSINNFFYAYFLREMARNGYISSLYRGIRERSSDFRFNIFANQIYPVPPREEQDKIVAYLDYQVSNINKLILSKRKQITLLEEYKKTKISEVVTKGLNPNVEMEDSGIDWIGKIPKHWSLKYNHQIMNEKKETINPNIYYPLLSLTKQGVIYRDIDTGKGKFPSTFDKYKIVEQNNLIFCLFDMDETPRTVGLSKLNGMITGAYNIFSVNNEYSNKFIYYFYLSLDNKKGLKPFYTSLRKVIKINTFLNINIPIPPLNEQKEIAAYLDDLIFKLDNLISKHKLYIEKLEEYKKTLISDVVTGKIDVRDIVIPEYEKVDIVENNNEDTDKLEME